MFKFRMTAVVLSFTEFKLIGFRSQFSSDIKVKVTDFRFKKRIPVPYSRNFWLMMIIYKVYCHKRIIR